MEIRKIMVVGAGQMGSGIAQVAAHSGYRVLLHDVKDEYLNRGLEKIANNLISYVKKGKISEEKMQQVLSRLSITTNLEAARDVDLVIEAATENTHVKKEIFQTLDKIVPAHTIIASNTSSISITELGATTQRPDKVIGMHFMNPVPVMKLVEIIRGLATSEATFNMIESLAKNLNKEPVKVNDFPGFVANRILLPMINEAIYTVYEGVASPEEVDKVMKLGMNHPMGPLQLADFIGLDTCLSIMEVLYEGFGDPKYRPCPLLKQYVNAGWLGKKSGRGFYIYE